MMKSYNKLFLFAIFLTIMSLCITSGLAKNKEIVLMTRVGPENDALKTVITEYQKLTGVNVKIDETGKEGFYDRQTTRLIAGGDLDVVFYMSDYGALFAASKLLTPLTPFLNRADLKSDDTDVKDFFPNTLNTFKYKNVLYGLPTDVSARMMNYNTKYVDAAPQTYDEYVRLAKKFTKKYNSNSPMNFGTCIQAKTGSESPVCEWLQVLWAMGGDVFDKNYKPLFNNAIGVKSLTFMADLYLKLHVVPEDTPAIDAAAAQAAFQQENAAFIERWNSDTVIFNNPVKSPKVAKNTGVNLIPGVKQKDGSIKRVPITHGWALGIPASSKNKEEAFKFIQWVTGKYAAQKYFMAGGTPARRSILSNPSNAKFRPELKVLSKTLELARSKPAIKEWPQISSILQQAHSSVFVKDKTPKQALNKAASQIYDLLKRAGYYKK
jgi:multiple sugar transport system substrate-binding protein